MSELWTIIISAISAVVTGFFTHLFTKRKYNAETNSIDIENLQKALDFYKELSDDSKDRLCELLDKKTSLESRVEKLQIENAELKILIEKQNSMIENQGVIIDELNIKIDELTQKVNDKL